MSYNLFNTLNEFTNTNGNIWFGISDFYTMNEDDIKNVFRSSLFQLTLRAKIFKRLFFKTLGINFSLGQGWVKNFKSERNKLKTWHCALWGEGTSTTSVFLLFLLPPLPAAPTMLWGRSMRWTGTCCFCDTKPSSCQAILRTPWEMT